MGLGEEVDEVHKLAFGDTPIDHQFRLRFEKLISCADSILNDGFPEIVKKKVREMKSASPLILKDNAPWLNVTEHDLGVIYRESQRLNMQNPHYT